MTRLRISLELLFIGLLVSWSFRALLYLDYQEYFTDITPAQVWMSFAHGLAFDLAAIAVLLFFPLWLLNVPWKKADSKRWIVTWRLTGYALLLAYALLLLGNHLYFAHTKRHMGRELSLLSNDFGLIFDILSSSYLWQSALAFLLLGIALGIVIKTTPTTITSSHAAIRIAAFVLIPLMVAITVRGGVSRGRPMGVVNAFEHGDYRYGNLVLNGAYSALRSGREHHVQRHKPDEMLLHRAKEEWGLYSVDEQHPFAQRIENPRHENMNVVLILLESWSFKYIDGLSGAGYGVTPNLDAIITDSLVYPQAYAVAQRSIEGIQGILASIAPLPGMSVLGNGLERHQLEGIGNIASRAGYETLFVQSSTRQSFRMESIARMLGFRHYYGMEDMRITLDYPKKEFPRFGWDYESLMLFREKIDQISDKPFLAVVFTGSTHVPYPELPEQFYRYPHGERTEHGLLNTIYYSDWALGEFMKWGRQQPWFDSTLFIITADHPLGAYTMGKKRHEALDDALRIPMVLYAPSLLPAGQNAVIASQLDILPTAVDVIGYRDTFSAMGTSLLRKQNSFALGTEGNILVGINEHGYLYHSTANRLDSGLWQDKQHEEQLRNLEQRLLFMDYTAHAALKSNNWITAKSHGGGNSENR